MQYLTLPHVQERFDVLMDAVQEILGPFSVEEFVAAVNAGAGNTFEGLEVQAVEDGGRALLLQVLEITRKPSMQYRHLSTSLVQEGAVGDLVPVELPLTYSNFAESLFDGADLSVQRFCDAFSDTDPQTALSKLLRLRPQRVPLEEINRQTTETLSNKAFASHAGNLSLSKRRLELLEPEIAASESGVLGRLFDSKKRDAHFWKKRIPEHLSNGDSRAAILVQNSPLIVSAYSDEIDNVLFLAFPENVTTLSSLKPGDKLLTVNTYGFGDAVDCENGPAAYLRYGQFSPYIADVLSEDESRIESRKREIEAHEWERAEHCTEQWLAKRGTVARDGRPTKVHEPIPHALFTS